LSASFIFNSKIY